MPAVARVGDPISGGLHCHGHDHGPQPSPGQIVEGSAKVFVGGRPAARAGDRGHSDACCGGVGDITLLPRPGKVFIDGRPVVCENNQTLHCGMGSGQVSAGSEKVRAA